MLNLGYGIAWDDNVFRIPDDAPDPEASRGISGRSDRYTTASIGLHLNLPYSMQRFLVDVTRSAVRYEKFSSREQDPFRYQGTWQWSLTPSFTGTLSASRAETRVDVEDVEGRRNIDQRVTTRSGTADAWITGGWHLLGSARQSDTTYDPPFLARPDTTQRTTEAGLRYIARSNSQLTVTRRWTRGTETITDPALLGGSDFTQDDTEASATWIVSGHSTLVGRVTRMKRHNELFPQRDFTATAGELRDSWRVTGRVTLDLSAVRNVEPYNISLESTTRIDDTLTAALTWAVTERVAITPNASRRVSRYGQVSTSLEARRDVTDAVGVGATWSPRRYVSLDLRYRREKRNSTEERQDFDSNVASINLQLTF